MGSTSQGSSQKPNSEQYYNSLERRIARIEAHLNLKPLEKPVPQNEDTPFKIPTPKTDDLEFLIGQFWFAKSGIVILTAGLAFLLTLSHKSWPSAVSSLVGYALAGSLFLLSHLGRKSFSYLSGYFLGGGFVLLFLSTLYLHFFSKQAAISGKEIVLLLTSLIVLINLFAANKRKSVYLVSLGITMGYVTAILGNSAVFIFLYLTFLSILVVLFYQKYHWNGVLAYAILSTYFVHLVWFLNNPLMGNKPHLVSGPTFNIFFVLLYIIIFAAANLFRARENEEEGPLIVNTFLNCSAGYGLYLFVTITRFSDHLAIYQLVASLLFLMLAISFWIKNTGKFSTFFFAILGYTALSAAIIIHFQKPDLFFWLCWQSLLVVTTAIWFRSKIIVLANFIIFLIIILAYILVAGKSSSVGLSLGLVALLSARILNWQKNRLELQTEFMRNAYLTTVFILIPYALYQLVPGGWVILSWVGTALFYYLLSILLSNKKYRWMALLTLLLTVVYIILVGTIQLTPVYRVVSFVVLGMVLLIISLIYSKFRAKFQQNKEKAE